ncbi:hypothetical protein MIPYR_10339 [uncultured Microbacterium sp.]|uniref:Uncharacterized protein n=1 Tax=uncultured Microbacterium sp. TaxID=191216 RepID=A0A1Y5NV19_9MICO|nr:hypothetical protein MIPYR_10339 [uncultured Microbacterium sp.]
MQPASATELAAMTIATPNDRVARTTASAPTECPNRWGGNTEPPVCWQPVTLLFPFKD